MDPPGITGGGNTRQQRRSRGLRARRSTVELTLLFTICFAVVTVLILHRHNLARNSVPDHNAEIDDQPTATQQHKIYYPDNSTKVQIAYDKRPHGSSGYLCVYGAKGRLNNLIIQNLIAIYMARQLNRTLLADAEVSTYYDIERLSLMTYPDWTYKPIMPITDTNFTCHDPKLQSKYSLNHQLTILERIEDYNKQTSAFEVAAIDNHDVWYWLGRPPEEIYERFFRALVPRPVFRAKVQTFLDQHNLRPDTYNAVHLRALEGNCGRFTELCCPKLDYVRGILRERGGILSKPIFVATDQQCSEEVIETYTVNATNLPIIMGYVGPCEGTECAVLDFELLLLSDVFVGNIISSVSMNVREGRLARYGKPGWLSVLSNEDKTLDLERTVRYLTRYWIGYWEFRKECDQLPPRKRASAPCV